MKRFYLIIYIKIAIFVVSIKDVNAGVNDSLTTNTNQILLKFEPKEADSNFDKTVKIITENLGSLVALLGLILAYPLLKRKLIENHIISALNKIQETNREIHKQSQKLCDTYLPSTFNDKIIAKEDIESVLRDIKDIYYLSQEGSSDATTLLFYLKNTLQGTQKNYVLETKYIMFSTQLYGLIIKILSDVNFYCSQVVQVPKSTKIEAINLLNYKELRGYVTHSDVYKYKYFNQGVIYDPKSLHHTLFYQSINRSNNSSIKRAAFQIHQNVAPIINLLFVNKIYAPPVLKPPKDPLFGADNLIFLIGFSIKNQFKIGQGHELPKELVELTYSNPRDDFHFIESIDFESIQNDVKDIYIENSQFSLMKANKLSRCGVETFTLEFELQYLKDEYKNNERRIKNKMKNSIKTNVNIRDTY
ncbi:hypothetical protein AHMF7605_08220 [Adhaeribacter arboris]|uniref:Uncharacterized protein n=1 Tax=Adhaeribacter arboris TaxID=2072846 RepID=A0A2T2YDB2_9BACT|nr:hypothetical protein [Adhaeribacter arboris]PSR53510.1 hypothetical protein AHMF7605_08220 [Adhaeribacter arboris]